MSESVENIVRALQSLGGEAKCEAILEHLSQKRGKRLTENEESSVRSTLQRYSANSPQRDPGCPGLFRNTTHGWWTICRAAEIKPVKFKPYDLWLIALARLAYDPERFSDTRQVGEEMVKVAKEAQGLDAAAPADE